MIKNLPNILSLALLMTDKCLAAYVPTGSSSWTTLTPTTTLSGVQTDYSGTFGIAIMPVNSVSSASGSATTDDITASLIAKRDYVSTVVQPVSQIGDGQIQGTYTYITTVKQNAGASTVYVTQTSTTTNTATQTQTQTATSTHTLSKTTTATSKCDNCVTSNTVFTLTDSDEATTTACDYTTYTTAVLGTTYIVQSTLDNCEAVVPSTTSEDEITTIYSTYSNYPTTTANSTNAFTSIYASVSTTLATSTYSSASSTATGESSTGMTSCKVKGTLTLTLHDSILVDSSNRIGSIVSNRQFQFDGPTPQAGAIYAAGWGVLDGRLALANSTVFYQCLSGTFYNLYDENIGAQCSPVYLEVVKLVDC
ncbi:hypothetical protein DASC09_012860 [Saccharomycopsis crataegensis]|uniref:Cell wall mannoprotein PIR1-like C-terminal domain-containing protein n=1 Tax=Saccharomycopsis crataegensis TaxID=43959 RepID=A0AAV5QH72_9ASCO|nr:hypothetical protein DASC09_012860 [Saccharomycopsis crataegensis]